MASLSVRRGKFAPSSRKKPERAYGASDTNWRIGVDQPSFRTTYDESCSKAREAIHEPRRKVNKNASDEVFDGGYSPPASDPRFSTVARMELTKSVHTPGFSIQRPKEGFDRLTANRTNYSLGEYSAASSGHRHFETATADLQTRHPRDRPPVEQPTLGGSTRSDGSYRLDMAARDSVRRGGGGGEGVFGVRFDVINGRGDEGARRRIAMRAGPRKTLNNAEKGFLHPTDGWGDMHGGMYVDILTGKARKVLEAPARGGGASIRSDTVAGRTRPW